MAHVDQQARIADDAFKHFALVHQIGQAACKGLRAKLMAGILALFLE